MAAFTIKSDERLTKSTIKNLFGFLTDFKNFKDLLPEDKVEHFQFEENSCSFNIRGITPLTVKLLEVVPYSVIRYKVEGFSKYTLVLEAVFKGDAESHGLSIVQMHGDLNPFLKVMAEKPLEQLANTMSSRMAELTV